MSHLPRQDATTFQVHDVTFRSFARSGSGAHRLGAWEAEFAPDTPGRPHRMTEEEVLLVLEGTLDVEVADETFTVPAGDAVLVPAGALFRVSNTAPSPARAWVTTSLGMSATMEADGQQLSPPWAQ